MNHHGNRAEEQLSFLRSLPRWKLNDLVHGHASTKVYRRKHHLLDHAAPQTTMPDAHMKKNTTYVTQLLQQ